MLLCSPSTIFTNHLEHIDRFESAWIAKVVALLEVRARFSELQSAPFGTTPTQMRQVLRNTTEQWAGIIAKAKISLD